MLKSILTFLFGFFLFANSFAQQTQEPTIQQCYSDEVIEKLLIDNPQLEQIIETKEQEIKDYLDLQALNGDDSPETSLIIPVAVFVIHDNGVENITDAQVISQIDILTTYFAPYGLKFCLATMKGTQNILTINTPAGLTSSTPGIFHLEDATLTNHNVNAQGALAATGSALSAANYLKIFVVKAITSNSLPPNAKILGYSVLPQFAVPATDGIFMSYDAFGDVNTCSCTTLEPYSELGRVMVHEVGHYLGLYHTFQGSCAGMSTTTCATQGDRVCDTPPVSSPNNGCPPAGHNTCNESPDLPDDIANYMDYTSEVCRTQFSVGQKNRMYAHLSLYRPNLTSSSNLVYTGTTCNGGVLANFTADNFTPCVGTVVNFSAIPATGVTYTWDFGDGSTGNGQNVSHTYSNEYMPTSVTLTVSDGTNSASYSNLIYVDSCPPIFSPEGNWYFSYKGGVNFATGGPVYDNGSYINNNWISEACAVQSNTQGDLLFYSDGYRVWDQNHNTITGGSTLVLGGTSSHEGVMSVPDPGNPNEYYLFTKDDVELLNGSQIPGTNGFRYGKIAINGTQASLTGTWNVPITLPTSAGYAAGNDNAILGGEGITALKSCDGYWIITTGIKGNDYYIVIFSLTASGLTYHSELISPYLSMQQAFEASQNGKKIAVRSGTNTSGQIQTVGLTLYDFDVYTGTFSNPYTLITGEKVFGTAFSPDNKLLYTTAWGNGGIIHQYDLEAANPSQTGIEVVTAGGGAHEIQRGPNNKLYAVRSSSQNLQVIHSPNTRVTSAGSNECQHSFDGPLMENNMGYAGLPNMIEATEEFVFGNTLTYDQLDCETYAFTPSLCSPTYLWNFGDPSSGVDNSSTQTTPTHIFSGPGIYVVSVTGNGTTLTDTIEIGTQSTIQGDPTYCPATSTLGNYSTNLQPGQSAVWSVTGGGITGPNNQTDIFVTWVSLPGTVTLTVTDNTTGCSSTSTFAVVEDCSTNGLDDLNANEMIQIYPNPSSGNIYISFKQELENSIQITLKSLDGKLISSMESNQQETLIKVPETVSNGILFVEVLSNGSKFTKKVILMK